MIMAGLTAAFHVYLLFIRYHMTQTETNIIKIVIKSIVDGFKWLPFLIVSYESHFS